jgi:hypothetical protein
MLSAEYGFPALLIFQRSNYIPYVQKVSKEKNFNHERDLIKIEIKNNLVSGYR